MYIKQYKQWMNSNEIENIYSVKGMNFHLKTNSSTINYYECY